MDALHTFHAWFTVVLLVIFLGIVWWAFSKHRAQAFREAAALPFADEEDAGRDREERS